VTEPQASRHLSSQFVAEYLRAGNRAVVVIAGEPVAHLIIDPPLQRVGLEVEWDGSQLPDLSEYAHLDSVVAYHDGRNWSQLWILDPRIVLDGYPMLCALADKVQIEGLSMGSGIPGMLASYKRILEGSERLLPQEEIGLMGELILLVHLIHAIGERSAVDGWLGGDRSEHDFSVASVDVEVKTTIAEVRRHWIGSHTQLTPTPGRQLVLVSIQLTTGIDDAISLGEQIERVRRDIGDAATVVDVDARLTRLGWRDAHAPQYRRRFRLRSRPLAFAVDEHFPAITARGLSAAGLPVERFSRVSYDLDVSGLPSMPSVPPFLGGFVGSSP